MTDAILLLCVLCCGSDDFADRELATARLERAGPLALPALLWGRASEDVEIRARCRPLLERIIPPVPKED